MRRFPVPPMSPAVVDATKRNVESGMPQQQVIREMRSAGLDIIDCIQLTQRFYDLPHNEAKGIVHFSEAWADMRESHDRLHETAEEAARQLGFVEVTDGQGETRRSA